LTIATFDEFAAAALPELTRLSVAITRGASEADDLVQDCLVRLAGAWERVDDQRDPIAYARVTLIRLNLNRARRMRRELSAVARFGRHEASRTASIAGEPTWEPWLSNAFAALSPRQRSAVALVHVWGYSIDETARVIACRPNTVKTPLARAMSTLRQAARDAGIRTPAKGPIS